MNQIPNEIDSIGDSSNPIFDIIQSLQSSLNEPEVKNNYSTEPQNDKKDLSELDVPKVLNILKNLGITNSNDGNSMNNDTSNQNFDISSIMNFQKIFSGVNKADPRKNLLYSLKPFLRETRQKNIDTYVTLLGVINALNIFSGKDRD